MPALRRRPDVIESAGARTGKAHFGGPQYALSNFGSGTKVTVYTGLIALLLNLVVSTVVTVVVRAAKRPYGDDSTEPRDYVAEAGDPGVEPLPAEPEEART